MRGASALKIFEAAYEIAHSGRHVDYNETIDLDTSSITEIFAAEWIDARRIYIRGGARSETVKNSTKIFFSAILLMFLFL